MHAFPALYARTPLQCLEEYLPYLVQHRIHPELYLSRRDLDQLNITTISRLAGALARHNLSCTLHPPPLPLHASSFDAGNSDGIQYLSRLLQVIRPLRPRVVVMHHEEYLLAQGADAATRFWQGLLPVLTATDTVIALENIHDASPTQLRTILEGVKDRRLRYCFDLGHFHLCSGQPLEEWLSVLGRYCVECHLHDNSGDADEHLPLGNGSIDLFQAFDQLARHAPGAVWTLEALNLQGIEQSRQYIQVWRQSHGLPNPC